MTGRSEDQPDRATVRAALNRSGDDGALLPGEEADAPAQADPSQWIAAYSELVQYKEALLAVSGDQTARMREETARVEARSVDEVIIRNQLARYRRRLEHWLERAAVVPRSGR